MMAACRYCGNEMSAVDSCALLDPDAIRYGSEACFGGELPERCHDCGVAPGGLHHPGCDMERCPVCRGQRIACGCDVP